MNKRITYKCKKCGWEGSVTAMWADIKPIFCPNEKCELSKTKGKGKKSFRSSPESLETILPKEEKKETVKKDKPVYKRIEPKKSSKKKDSNERQEDSNSELQD